MLYAVCDSERNKAAAFAVHAVGKRFGWGESAIAVARTVCCVPEDWLVRNSDVFTASADASFKCSYAGAAVCARETPRGRGSRAVRLNRLVDDLLFGRIPVQAFT